MTKATKHLTSGLLLIFLSALAIGSFDDSDTVKSPSVQKPATHTIQNWPSAQDIDKWAAKVVRDYDDPEIECNKITGIDSPTKGAIRIKGIWCAQDQGVGSHGMNVAVDMMGNTINKSFRRQFPSFKGPLTVSIWDNAGRKAFGSRDWK